jgi:hypothetical protein
VHNPAIPATQQVSTTPAVGEALETASSSMASARAESALPGRH